MPIGETRPPPIHSLKNPKGFSSSTKNYSQPSIFGNFVNSIFKMLGNFFSSLFGSNSTAPLSKSHTVQSPQARDPDSTGKDHKATSVAQGIVSPKIAKKLKNEIDILFQQFNFYERSKENLDKLFNGLFKTKLEEIDKLDETSKQQLLDYISEKIVANNRLLNYFVQKLGISPKATLTSDQKKKALQSAMKAPEFIKKALTKKGLSGPSKKRPSMPRQSSAPAAIPTTLALRAKKPLDPDPDKFSLYNEYKSAVKSGEGAALSKIDQILQRRKRESHVELRKEFSQELAKLPIKVKDLEFSNMIRELFNSMLEKR